MADINTDQFYQAVLTILDSKQRPAAVDGIPVWASSDPTVLAVTPSPDGMGAIIDTVAPGGPARITVTADADRGAGVETITGVSEDIMVTEGPSFKASSVVITLGAPVAKP